MPQSIRTSAAAMAALLVLLLCAPLAQAQDPDIPAHPNCPLCNMDRAKFAHSRMLVQFEDGSEVGYCSLHCALADLAVHLDRIPVAFLVGDHDGKKLVKADEAVWVLDEKNPGVMTRRAKWAFADKAAAEAYIAANGGVIISFDDAVKAAYDDMYQDTRMIMERRKAKRAMQKPAG